MDEDKNTVLDYALTETEAEQEMSIAARLERRLARAGYVPVLHIQEKARPTCPQGFFMMEYRRLDDPRYRAVTSLKLKRSSPEEDLLEVTFDKVPLKYERSLSGLVNAFRFRASADVPVTISAQQAVNDYKKGQQLPKGEAVALCYRALAYTLQNRTAVRFFVDAGKIGHDYVVLSSRVERDAYESPRALLSPNERFINSRHVFLSVPTNLDVKRLSLYIKADNALPFLHKRQPTVPQKVPMWEFTHLHQDIIRHHVKGTPHVMYSFAPEFERF